MATHAIGLDDKATPQRQWTFAKMLVIVLLLGLVICGAANLTASYHNSTSLDGREQPISVWGTGRLDGANAALLQMQKGALNQPAYNQIGHIGFGVALAGFLEWACLAMPKWPIHPIGLIMVHTFYANEAWASIFLGWLLKVLLLRYGGARVYRAAKPVFLGLIMGEVFAAVLWSLVPAILVMLDMPYIAVQIQPY